MLKERSQTFFFSLGFFDLVASFVAFGLAMIFRFVVQEPTLVELREINLPMYAMVSVIVSMVQVSGFFGMGLYRIRRVTTAGHEVSRIVTAVALNVLFVVSGLYFFRIEHVSRLTILYYALFFLLLVSTRHTIVDRVLSRLNYRKGNLRSVIIIGTGDAARRITEIFERHTTLGFSVQGYVHATNGQPANNTGTILGSFGELKEIITRNKPDMVVYTLNDQRDEYLTTLLDLCDQSGISLKIVPSFSGLVAAKGDVETLEGIPVISIREVPARIGFNRFVKRSFDLIFSMVIILLLSPIFVLVALAIKVTSPGPVFYSQDRVGLDNRPFKMFKFRTMRVQEKQESDTTWTTKGDPRITPIGGILRKLSIDELPQFFNVVRGHMSVVGPRPERPHFVEQFRNEYRHYMRRHAMKAGITGWAQINGLRGDTSIQERIEADIFYIENWDFWLDLKIILLTPFKGMVSKNAY